ncbi:MAG TPA: SNF2-related protein [Agitococcus sp.]|nr:SNF2-related protein [Agitococcus sp.]
MFEFFRRKKQDVVNNEPIQQQTYTFIFNESGVLYPYLTQPKTELDFYWQTLEQESFAYLNEQHYVLPWDEFFQLLDDEQHLSILRQMQLPTITALRPIIRSENALSDNDFKIIVAGWCDEQGIKTKTTPTRQGAILTIAQQHYLLPKITWELTENIREFARLTEKSKRDNEKYWGKIRRLAQKSHASMDEFLKKTIILSPETLQLNMRRQNLQNDSVIEIQPTFEDAPNTWLNIFDKFNQVQEHYSITLPDGGIAHVLIDDKVKNVLQEIKRMASRRVTGERAERFLKNPYSQLGEDATTVIPPESFEKSKQQANIFSYDLTVASQYDEQGFFQLAQLQLEASTEQAETTVFLALESPNHASYLVKNYLNACQSNLNYFYWAGYEIILSPKTQQHLEQLRHDLQTLLQKNADRLATQILDINAYGERVIGIGLAPVGAITTDPSGEVWIPVSRQMQLFEKIKPNITPLILDEIRTAILQSKQQQANQVQLPYLEQAVSVADALDIEYRVDEYLRQQEEQKDSKEAGTLTEAIKPSILLIKNNIDNQEYITERRELLAFDFNQPKPILPKSFRVQEFTLKPHQHIGIAWLQHLYSFAPTSVTGCLLADDMGLGKTIQLLCFIGAYLEQNKSKKPILIVAPVSLLENWQAEANKFFTAQYGKILSLYGEHLKSRKLQTIPTNLEDKGIKSLLQENWRGEADIVLTTYETLRDLQFSLGREHWSIMICDEAQKIKTPNALVTQAAKAMSADFKIACTGTPVENSLVDLWCLFDFIQAGLLGSLKEFIKNYRQPIENEDNNIILQQLRDLINPQTLRRMKSEVAALPAKIEKEDCKSISISQLQRGLYEKVITEYELVVDEMRNKAILAALHTMRTICAHPLQLDPKQPRSESPKLEWLLRVLAEIKTKQEKVIIFTEFRNIQLFLQRMIQEYFGLNIFTINGDTASSGHSNATRQKLIDTFQNSFGFNVIIMSPVAVGFGVNVQKANHVIHYTRCWNPAKEDQATDRAYRIGQEKEVFVYYPSVYSSEFETFEIKLDRLLNNKRQLATDMLKPSNDIDISGLVAGVLTSIKEDDYTPDWEVVSRNTRQQYDWICQDCGLDFKDSTLRKFLHVHHVNGRKHENHATNLKVLCIRCHAEQPNHQHMCNHQDYLDFIQLIRNHSF